MLEEEAHHLATGVRPAWLRVRPGHAAAGPCVAGSVKNPLLEHGTLALVGLNGAGVADPARSLAMADDGPQI